jgi:hypothetical protein
LDITRNTGRNKGCLSVVPVRRGGRRPLMFDVACNMARNIFPWIATCSQRLLSGP